MATTTLGSKATGSIIKLKENGKLMEFYVGVHNYESGLNGSGRTLVVRKDVYDQRQWHTSDVNAWANCSMRSWLNSTYLNMLDADIRALIGTTKYYYTPGNGNYIVTTRSDAIFLLSLTELGESTAYVNVEGSVLPIAKKLKIAYQNGSATSQWTRSPYTDTTMKVWSLLSDGDINFNGFCTFSLGSRPAFTLPSTLYVSDDGTITANTAPTTPGSITVPGSIQGGTSITVKWGASTDAQNNLEGYICERSTNGGTSWSQIYQGGALQTSNTVAFGTASVMYRVKAYDSEGLQSGYKTSGNVTVVNNRAPGAPASISVPTAVNGGKTLTVTWGKATDSDGNLSGYSLERSYNGGSFAQVYKGAALSYTDTITKGWTKVAYRVRAYDAIGAYSAYTTSPTRTVNNNTAPTITCSPASGSDLGTKTGGFSISYSVNDADSSDTLTVTEKLDNSVKRTFTATRNASNSFDVTGSYFMQILNGKHTLTIQVSDGKASATHTLTFTKAVTSASVTLAEPMEADAQITVAAVSVLGSIPADADYTVEITNNAKDDAPVWEDCTAAVKTGANHVFTNQTAANGFAFNFRITVERGESGIEGHILSIQGGFQ